MSAFDRRRVALATAFTVVALPSLWLIQRDDAARSTSPTTAAAGVGGPRPAASTSPSTTQYVPELPSFLDGPAPPPPPAVVNIAVPGTASQNQAKVTASFRRFDDPSGRPCTTLIAPEGATITVTDVDNGLSTTCVNRFGATLPRGVDIVLHTDLYTTIADLADAPISVRLSW
jgi:hypothetical protein